MKAIPVPYDFDMCGLVNANYAVVSQVGGETLPITDVTQRFWRGFKRPPGVYEQVRDYYLDNKDAVLAKAEDLKPAFRDVKEYDEAREFILEFYSILESPADFKRQILDKARTK